MYDKKIAEKWLKFWEENDLFSADPDSRKKYFVTFPYPYLNGPLHLGHAFSGSRTDAVARYKRHKGYNVLFPFAFHATGEPVAGVASRLRAGDKKMYEQLKASGLSDDVIESFKDPMNIIGYYRKRDIELASKLGFSVDWRRQFVTVDPEYNKFIEWQYLTLREKGYVGKGTHPVIWCPHCRSPTGDHDRLVGEGVSPTEFVLLKFKFRDGYLVPGTLRPETIFGVTNMWINPEAEYVKAKVDDEVWYISKATVKKLEEQLHNVEILQEFKGKEIIGDYSINPINGEKVPNLPADFVDPEGVTGVVMSVPAHAPYDWLALRDLQADPSKLKEYGIDPELVRGIKLISLIAVEGFGEFPAVEVVDSLGVKDQKDPKAEEATKIVYKKEFHTGILKDITGKYSGTPVREIKDRITEDFVREGIATKMWEPEDEVICRCGTRCIVKILKDQWFLKYSNPEWKARVRAALKHIKILPEEYRMQFENALEWLQDKACARKSGLGTRLPWDKDWLVETLSDSTIYMAFYTISKYIYGGVGRRIRPEQLTPDVFEYIFHGIGDPEGISRKTGIPSDTLQAMHKEFEYWYGVDFRNSGKDLINNHLLFYIFHHVAIWDDEKYWPKVIGVNGFVTSEGEKMSKSKGNVVRLEDAISQYGPDVVRMALLYSAEGTQDPDWRASSAEALFGWFNKFLDLVDEVKASTDSEPNTILDKWLISRLALHIERATKAYEDIMLRSAIQAAFYDILNDISWYKRRGGNNTGMLRKAVKAMAVMMEPIVPFLAEEAWHRLGEEGSVCTATWPQSGGRDEVVEKAEEFVRGLYEDMNRLVGLMKEKPEKAYIYVAEDWKRKAVRLVKGEQPKDFVKVIMSDPEIRAHGKDASDFAKVLMRRYNEVSGPLTKEGEMQAIEEAKPWLEKELGIEVDVQDADSPTYDPAGKAKRALPMKPAIYLG